MSATSTLLLFEKEKLVGFTNDQPWAGDWCAAGEQRVAQIVTRLDRPPHQKGSGAHGGGSATGLPRPTLKPKELHFLEVHFDGGCRPTNPGNRYGSFRVVHPQPRKKAKGQFAHVVFQNERIEFGWGTSNEAEFMALLAGLDWALNWLASWSGRPAKGWQVRMVTDSTILQRRVLGVTTGTKTEAQQRMAALTEQVQQRLMKFGDSRIEWRRREHNVRLFGH